MDYLYFNSPSQAYQFIGLPPTPAYSQAVEDPTKLTGTDPLDPSSFLSANYDAFTFAPIIPTTAGSPPPSHTAHAAAMPVASVDSGFDLDDASTTAVPQTRRDSSEEKEGGLTPAQSRRKAQNRAAQRAFRERKERHVKDLEARLSALQSSASSLQSDNERLKLALQRAKTENEILRASAGHLPPHPHSPTSSSARTSTSEDAYMASSSLPKGATGSALLSMSATWDLIMSHPLVKQGSVDIADVCERIRPLAKCEGQGPVYEEREIWKAVEASRRAGGDELI